MKIELNHIIEFLSLLIALYNYRYIKGSRMVWTIPFLFFVLYAELGASYYKYVLMPNASPPIDNTHIYIWVSIVETCFYSSLLISFLRRKIFIVIAIISGSILALAFLSLFFFFRDYLDYYYYLLAGEGYVLTIISCCYFYEYFLTDEMDSKSIFTKPDFWITIGILVFFAGISVVDALYYYLKTKDLTIGGLRIYNLIPQVLCVCLYGCLSVSIILWSKQTRISSRAS